MRRGVWPPKEMLSGDGKLPVIIGGAIGAGFGVLLAKFHEQWMLQEMGVPFGQYPWGKVFLVCDMRRGGGFIGIDYEKEKSHTAAFE